VHTIPLEWDYQEQAKNLTLANNYHIDQELIKIYENLIVIVIFS